MSLPPMRLIAKTGAILLVALLITGKAHAEPQASTQQPIIAIIIDDMGNNDKAGRQLIYMPYPLTLSFLPHRPFTKRLATLAHHMHNKEIMLHAPMANQSGMALGAGALTPDMNGPQIRQSLIRSLESIPFVQGVNNHMGSALTQQRQPMQWVMEVLRDRPLYFVDSRTIASSVAYKVAQQSQIPSLSRDVFLDHWQTRRAVHFQFQKLIKVAQSKGYAIAIGHPHQVTVDYLKRALPRLDEKGIRLATVSALWSALNNGQTMFDHRSPTILAELQNSSPPTH